MSNIPKRITKIEEINFFSFVGKVAETPTLGVSHDKKYCEIKIRTMKIKQNLALRVYGAKADKTSQRYRIGDILYFEGTHIETLNGIELVIKKIARVDTKGEFIDSEKDFKRDIKVLTIKGRALAKYGRKTTTTNTGK